MPWNRIWAVTPDLTQDLYSFPLVTGVGGETFKVVFTGIQPGVFYKTFAVLRSEWEQNTFSDFWRLFPSSGEEIIKLEIPSAFIDTNKTRRGFAIQKRFRGNFSSSDENNWGIELYEWV